MNKFFYFFIFLFFFSCNRSGKVNTPKDFINHVTVRSSIYSKDSISILIDLYDKMKNHESSFQNPEYFDLTKLYLGTILYNSTLKKVAFFVIAENPVKRNPHSDSKLPCYYNANCYLGKRLFTGSSIFELKNIGPMSLANFEDKTTASQAVRESYYSELTTFLDSEGNPNYEYNVNDKRFWESPKGWKRVFP